MTFFASILKSVGRPPCPQITSPLVKMIKQCSFQLGFHGGTQSGIVDINEPLEIVFHLNIPTACWKTLKGTRVTWWKDGDVINNEDCKGRIRHMTDQVPKDGTLSLVIDTCTPEDSGFYQVKVMSEKGNILTSNHKQIAVMYERPNFVQPLPRVIDIDLLKKMMCGDKVDASVTLSCECAGKPEVNVSWHLAPKGRKNVPVYSSDNYEISLNSGVAKLYIKNIFAELGDWISSDGELEPTFICRAETSLGYAETSTALVIKSEFLKDFLISSVISKVNPVKYYNHLKIGLIFNCRIFSNVCYKSRKFERSVGGQNLNYM